MAARAELHCIPRGHAPVRRHVRANRVRTAVPRLAVIPFDDLTGDDRGSRIGDALTVLVVANLACRDAVDVVSGPSTMRYKGAHVALAGMARAQGARHIVGGAILRHGQELQVVIQLVDAHTGEASFIRTYTGRACTLERIQTAIAWQITDELVAAAAA